MSRSTHMLRLIAGRWLIVMPLFTRGPARPDQTPAWQAGPTAASSPPGVAGQPGPAVRLAEPSRDATPVPQRARVPGEPPPQGPYSMCYAVSTGADPFGPYYRYEFLMPLFPDYPRPAVWSDGYYTSTSTGDDVIQKHACVADRARMLRGEPASEQCFVVDGVNFLNTADIDGMSLPPPGSPNIVMATGGTQLKQDYKTTASMSGTFTWTGRLHRSRR
jgi:hypothetical protein